MPKAECLGSGNHVAPPGRRCDQRDLIGAGVAPMRPYYTRRGGRDLKSHDDRRDQKKEIRWLECWGSTAIMPWKIGPTARVSG